MLARIVGSYFVALPIAYFYLMIKLGKQKLWKLLIVFGTSSAVCRYSLPPELADYFEFVSYVRYPIIAVLLLIELALVFHIAKLLWQSRKLSGDPRVRALIKLADEPEPKRTTGLLLAFEPACWYYLIPKFSRQHVPALAHIQLLSAKFWWLLVLVGLLTLAVIGSYLAIQAFSEIVAMIVATVIGYTVFSLIANYRLSRHFSLYVLDGYLVINNSFFGLLVLPVSDIIDVEITSQDTKVKDSMQIGKGEANLKVSLSKPACYYGLMGSITEEVDHFYLRVDHPEAVIQELKEQ